MKRSIAALLALCLLAALGGCGSGGAEPAAQRTQEVVVTLFPLYDWTRNIAGTEEGITLLLDNGTDMHSYQPSVEDVVKISTCSLFIYVGGESDAWVEDALKNAANPDLVALNLMDVLGDSARMEEAVEGMQTGAGEEEGEYDEHIWLSLKNAEICCAAIAEAMAQVFPEHASEYAAGAAAYAQELDALDAAYRTATEQARTMSHRQADVLLFADRFPFRYLLEDYRLRYYAAFSGCEAETEASFETVRFLAGKVDELGLPVVLTTESPVPRLAETVVENTAAHSARILALDSMQSVTAAQIAGGAGYLGIMEQNLKIIEEAMA